MTADARGGEASVSKSLAEGIGRRHECMLLFSPVPLEVRLRWFLRWFFGDKVPWITQYYRRRIRKFHPDAAILFGDLDCSMLQACLDMQVPTILALHSYWPVCPKSSFWNEILKTSCAHVFPGARNCTVCVDKTLQLGSSTLLKSVFSVSRNLRLINNDLIRFNLDLTRKRIQRVDQVIVPSHYLQKIIAKELELASERVHVVHNGVDTSFFVPRVGGDPPPPKKKIVLFSGVLTGGLGRLKGFAHFVRLARLLNMKRSDVQFVATGGVMSGVEPVRCVGYLSRHDMVRLYQDSCLALVLSIWDEPFGQVVTEPMACAKPTIAYASGGIGEIVEHGTTGLLAPQGDLAKVAEHVEYLLDNESFAKKLGANARKRVETLFSSTSMVEKYLDLTRKVAF